MSYAVEILPETGQEDSGDDLGASAVASVDTSMSESCFYLNWSEAEDQFVLSCVKEQQT